MVENATPQGMEYTNVENVIVAIFEDEKKPSILLSKSDVEHDNG